MLERYFKAFIDGYGGYFNYFIYEVTHPGWHNYFYFLIVISLFFWGLEYILPWRKKQSIIRQDFWLDGFYMFFNFFFFNLLIFNAISGLTNVIIKDVFNGVGLESLVVFDLVSLPYWSQLLIYFVFRDFISFNTHRILHRIPFLWNFHKVHHSVKQMGFAAHLRYHWGETIVYRVIEFIPLSMIGFGVQDFIIIHFISIAIGHFNHSNFTFKLGPLKYIFNNPEFHIWHHAKELPNNYGVNYAISFSFWDYLFRTNHQPYNGRDIELGFIDDDDYPKSFKEQFVEPFKKKLDVSKQRKTA